MSFRSNQLLLIEEAIQSLEAILNRKISLSEFYLLILRNSLKISVNLFESVLSQQGRYIPFSKEECINLLKNKKDKRLAKWKWIDPNEIYFDKIKKRYYAFGKSQTQISGLWNLSMLGSETKHIESLFMYESCGTSINIDNGHVLLTRGNRICKLIYTLPNETLIKNQERIKFLKSEIYNRLYHKKVDGFTTSYKMKTKPSELEIQEAELLKKELCEALKQPTQNPAKNYSTLSDFTHLLVCKKDNLDKLVEFLRGKNQKEQTTEKIMTSKGVNTLKAMIIPFLQKQGISLQQPNMVLMLSKVIVLNNFKLSDEAIRNCIKILNTGTLTKALLATTEEAELLIILGSLLHQEKYEKNTTLVEHIVGVVTDSGMAAPGERTIGKYLDQIAHLRKSKYSLTNQDSLV